MKTNSLLTILILRNWWNINYGKIFLLSRQIYWKKWKLEMVRNNQSWKSKIKLNYCTILFLLNYTFFLCLKLGFFSSIMIAANIWFYSVLICTKYQYTYLILYKRTSWRVSPSHSNVWFQMKTNSRWKGRHLSFLSLSRYPFDKAWVIIYLKN